MTAAISVNVKPQSGVRISKGTMMARKIQQLRIGGEKKEKRSSRHVAKGENESYSSFT